MDKEIAKELGVIKSRINEIETKMNDYINSMHAESTDGITDTQMALTEIYEMMGGIEE